MIIILSNLYWNIFIIINAPLIGWVTAIATTRLREDDDEKKNKATFSLFIRNASAGDANYKYLVEQCPTIWLGMECVLKNIWKIFGVNMNNGE